MPEKTFRIFGWKKCTAAFPMGQTESRQQHKCAEICKTNNCIYLSKYVEEVNENFQNYLLRKKTFMITEQQDNITS